MSVLFDTNALMMPAQFPLDLFDQIQDIMGAFEPIVLEGSVLELAGLAKNPGRNGAAARYGLALAEKCTTVRPDEPVPGTVDEQVLAYAGRTGCPVVTNDRDLRNALLARGIGVISLRKQKRLELIRS